MTRPEPSLPLVPALPSVSSLPPPAGCPACGAGLMVTRLSCPACGTEVTGAFVHPGAPSALDPQSGESGHSDAAAGAQQSADSVSGGVRGPVGPARLVHLAEPHASLLELFLRVRGNVKDVERELGLSYPTVRARLDEAFRAAQPLLSPQSGRSTAPAPMPPVLPVAPARVPRETRTHVLNELERGEITATEAAARLRALASGQST